MKKIIRYFSLVIGLTTSFSSLAKEKISLMLDWYVNPDHAAIIVAQQKGFFEKNNLESRLSNQPIHRYRLNWLPQEKWT